MIKPADLKILSDNTFFDNDQGLINPGDHRAFNNKLIDYAQSVQPATFVVDSDDALNVWATAGGGNDYTHVLIRPGTFTTATTINLIATATKTIVGMGGSKIVTSAEIGIQGNGKTAVLDDEYISDDCHITGVTLESIQNSGVGFKSCNHLLGCNAIIINNLSIEKYAGFSYCGYLSDCSVHCDAATAIVDAYYECKFLNNCSCQISSSGTSKCFSYCGSLANCYGNNAIGIAFFGCRYLTNCIGTVCSGSCFSSCICLTNCRGKSNDSTSTKSASGFSGCNNLTNCIGVGIGHQDKSYGFIGCIRLFGCRPYKSSTTATYNECYMDKKHSWGDPIAAIAVANTAAGGYNLSQDEDD